MKVLPPRRDLLGAGIFRGFVWLGICCAGVAPCRAPPPACGLPPPCVPGLYGQPALLRPWVVRPDYIPSPLRGFVWLGDCCAGVAPCRAPPPACGLSPFQGLLGEGICRGFVWLGDCCTGVAPCWAPPPVCGLSPLRGSPGSAVISARNDTCSSLGTTLALR